jgi:hypothetical protein
MKGSNKTVKPPLKTTVPEKKQTDYKIEPLVLKTKLEDKPEEKSIPEKKEESPQPKQIVPLINFMKVPIRQLETAKLDTGWRDVSLGSKFYEFLKHYDIEHVTSIGTTDILFTFKRKEI